MLLVNNLTDIASKTTPNTFLIICIPLGPKIFSIFFDVFSTTKIKITFKIMAIIMFSVEYSDLIESSVVRLPGPAISGNASGNIDAVELVFPSSL